MRNKLIKTLAEVEENHIKMALDLYNWSLAETADALAMEEEALIKKINLYHIIDHVNNKHFNLLYRTELAPKKEVPVPKTMADMEVVMIEKTLEEHRGNLTEAAKALGVGRAFLYRKIKQFQIDPSKSRRKKYRDD